MIRTILGAETFRKGMDLYFERHDGEAATVEDFLKVFEDVSGRDLSQFALWYHQAGTPNLTVTTAHDAGKAGIRARDRAVGAADAFRKPQAPDAHPAGLRPRRTGRQGHRPWRRPKARRSRTASSTSASAAMSCGFPAFPSGRRCRSTAAFPRRSRFPSNSGRRTSSSSRATTAIRSRAGRPTTRCSREALIAAFRRTCSAASRRSFRANWPTSPASIAADETLEHAYPRAGAGAAGRSRHRPRDRQEHRPGRGLRQPRGAGRSDRQGQRARSFARIYAALDVKRPLQPGCGERRAAGAAQRAARLSRDPARRRGPCRRAFLVGHQHDRPRRGADGAGASASGFAAGRARRLRPSRQIPRRSAGHGQMVPDPGDGAGRRHARHGPRADGTSRFLDGQSQPRAGAGRHIRQRQPDRLQPRRRRRLRSISPKPC